MLTQAAAHLPANVDLRTLAVRTLDELEQSDALVIPGGESTTMTLIAERTGLLEPLRAFVRSGKPVWGTCAGPSGDLRRCSRNEA